MIVGVESGAGEWSSVLWFLYGILVGAVLAAVWIKKDS